AVGFSSKVWKLDESGSWVEGTPVPTAGYPSSLGTIAVVSDTEVYVGGGNGGTIARWTGSKWNLETPGGGLALWTASVVVRDDVVLFGNDAGKIFRRTPEPYAWVKVYEDASARAIRD